MNSYRGVRFLAWCLKTWCSTCSFKPEIRTDLTLLSVIDMSDPLLDILKSSIPDSSIETDPEYLDHLRNLPQSLIGNERAHLETSSQAIKSTLSSLAKMSHRQLLSSQEAVAKMTETLQELDENVSSFKNRDLAKLQEISSQLLKKQKSAPIQSLVDGHSVVLLRNLDKIQDILELPTLTLTCVRNNYYAEALDFAAHARRLSIRYGHLNIIKSIGAEIDQIMEVMKMQLFNLLRETSRLPTMIKIISYLRRLAPFQNNPTATSKLQRLFLAFRLYFIRVQLKALLPLKQTSAEKYLKRYIEVFREHVFATCTGFRTVFPNSESSEESDRLIGEFLRSAVKDLYSTVSEISPLITDSSSRSSLCLQIAYCSQSLGRVGGEFWPTVQALGSAISLEEWNEAILKQRDISQRLGRV